MLDDTQQSALIEKYFEGSLTDEEILLFRQQWAENETFRQEVQLQEVMIRGLHKASREELFTQLDNAESQLKAKKESNKGLLDQLKEKIVYTLEELEKMFAPIPNYQAALSYTVRAHSVQVLSPENGINCSNNILDFELEAATGSTLKIVVENNRRQKLIKQTMDGDQASFSVFLPEVPPGRYYWKLISDKGVVLREFFVGKELVNNDDSN